MERKLSWCFGALLVVSLAWGCEGDGSVDPAVPPLRPPPAAITPPAPLPPGAAPAPGIHTARLRYWERQKLGDMPASWVERDGAQMVQLATGRILMIGGWSLYDPWGPNYVPGEGGGDRVTNEVWKSDDRGATWSLLLAHDPTAPKSGPGARFPPTHATGIAAYNGHAVVLGTDSSVESSLLGEVWHESNNGTTWTLVATDSPTTDRALFMCGNYNGAIYVMGGQEFISLPETAYNDVWRSTNGGVTWTRLANAPWSPRGMVYAPTEHAGKLYIVGGGRYADAPAVAVAFNGVYTFDGSTWQTVLPEGHHAFEPAFYQPLISVDGRLWLFNGYDSDHDVDLARAMFSDNDGLTWASFAGGAGGDEGSHADALVVAGDQIIRISGNLSERAIWRFGRAQ